MTSSQQPLHLFQGFGVEMEYMIVHRHNLQVLPICDKLIYDEVGAYLSDVEFGQIAWSNELVLHVVELKTQLPVSSLTGWHQKFQEHVRKINHMLEKYEAMLLPTGAHPLMNPDTDTKLWPHEHNAVYEAYNRIFDCRGHGWSNLQSTHLNLSFQGDEEFAKLHAAIRVVLPILPALSASTPLLEGKYTGFADSRLEVYRHNQKEIPSIAGKVIPEAVFTKAAYEQQILQKMYDAIASKDPEGVLQEEFLNSRGAIARFERNAIEIRVLDIQECPLADVAILQAIVTVVKALVNERWVPVQALMELHEDQLAIVLHEVIKHGGDATIKDAKLLDALGFRNRTSCLASELWQHLVKEVVSIIEEPEVAHALDVILNRGNLAKRIKQAAGETPSEDRISQIYHQLAACLQTGKMYIPE